MNTWKNNFNEKTLKQGLKYKANIKNTKYDGYALKSTITSKNDFDIKLILQDNILYDMSCSCSKKSPCAHEAGLLYFLEEFPEILEDLSENIEHEKNSEINIDNDLKIISESKLKKFLKKEFKKNPKLKYNFIKHFSTESLIDHKSYERKLKSILRNGGKEYGYYKLHNMKTPLKNFVKKDIYLLIEQKEYELAFKLLNNIMDNFIDPLYWSEDAWYEIAFHYREYIYYMLEKHEFNKDDVSHAMENIEEINQRVF